MLAKKTFNTHKICYHLFVLIEEISILTLAVIIHNTMKNNDLSVKYPMIELEMEVAEKLR